MFVFTDGHRRRWKTLVISSRGFPGVPAFDYFMVWWTDCHLICCWQPLSPPPPANHLTLQPSVSSSGPQRRHLDRFSWRFLVTLKFDDLTRLWRERVRKTNFCQKQMHVIRRPLKICLNPGLWISWKAGSLLRWITLISRRQIFLWIIWHQGSGVGWSSSRILDLKSCELQVQCKPTLQWGGDLCKWPTTEHKPVCCLK